MSTAAASTPDHEWRQNGAMPSIQIKNVPPETHAVLRRRAAAANQSLQEYLLGMLNQQAAQPTMEEIFAEIQDSDRVPVTAAEIAALVRADRDSR